MNETLREKTSGKGIQHKIEHTQIMLGVKKKKKAVNKKGLMY